MVGVRGQYLKLRGHLQLWRVGWYLRYFPEDCCKLSPPLLS